MNKEDETIDTWIIKLKYVLKSIYIYIYTPAATYL